VDRRSDIYSLACVLYETLAGQPPFTGPTAQAIMARHSLDAVPRLKIVRDAIPDDLELVIERALEKVPADRYQTSGEFAKALTTASTGRVSRITAARRPSRAQLTWRRRMNVGVGVGVIVLVAGAWLLFGRRHSGTGGGTGALAQNRVAVLYFTDDSRDSSLRYLADGLTESLIDQLSAIRALDVVSRNGVAPFRGRDVPRDSIARTLDAGTLVEGSVEPVGSRARVTIRLVDGASAVDVRRQSFELPIGAPLALRDSLIGQAAVFLRERLGDEVRLREQRAGTSSVEAWTLVQQAQKSQKDASAAALTDPTAASALYAHADSLLDDAERSDRAWLQPVVQRARVAYLRARLERVPKEVDKWLTVGLGHADRALRAEPQNPDALEIRGTLLFWRYTRGLEPDAAAAQDIEEFRLDPFPVWVMRAGTARIERTLFARDSKQHGSTFWSYRKIVRNDIYEPARIRHEVSLVNWPLNDYWEHNVIDKPAEDVAVWLEESRQLSLSVLYWMQTEAPRHDSGVGYPGLYLVPDIAGTSDGLAMAPYFRESRRVKAAFTVTENHVGADARQPDKSAARFDDSVGVGYYRIDLHPTTAGNNYLDIASLPFQIPLGALIPLRMENLLPACKNIGTTHITNGCYRLHPVEWNIGEAAGALAAFALDQRVAPASVHQSSNLVHRFQDTLAAEGVPLAWPE